MKKFSGVVVSTKNTNTAIVEIVRYKVHPIYEKRTKRTRRYPVHDLMNTKVEDIVEFAETKPYSKTKRWIITGINTSTNSNIKKQNAKLQIKNKKERESK